MAELLWEMESFYLCSSCKNRKEKKSVIYEIKGNIETLLQFSYTDLLYHYLYLFLM